MTSIAPGGFFQPEARLATTDHQKRSDDWKLVIDIGLALVLLIFLSPLMLLVALAIWLDGHGGVLFAHERIGQGGRPFSCLKFRTMRPDAKQLLADLLERSPEARAEWAQNQKLARDPRVTRLGVFLRKSSIDEIPQLLNVLQGSMSLVGPRPIVADEIVRYGKSFASYCDVRPGMTGLWQVSGRSRLRYSRRVALDRCYVRRWSLAMDAWIIVATVPAVLARRGAS